MHLDGFTIEIYYAARPYERQISLDLFSFDYQNFRSLIVCMQLSS